jgi:hypothetical protein
MGLKMEIKYKIILIVIIILLFSSLVAAFTFLFDRISTLEYHLEEKKRDDFIIQIIYSIIEDNSNFIADNTNLNLYEINWKDKINDQFYIVKDTGFSWVTYIIYFNNDFKLLIDTGKKINDYYGGGIFEINGINELNDDLSEFDYKIPSGQYYYIGKHRIYTH